MAMTTGSLAGKQPVNAVAKGGSDAAAAVEAALQEKTPPDYAAIGAQRAAAAMGQAPAQPLKPGMKLEDVQGRLAIMEAKLWCTIVEDAFRSNRDIRKVIDMANVVCNDFQERYRGIRAH